MSVPVPGPVPTPPGGDGGRDLAAALDHLEQTDPQDLDAVLDRAEQTHARLRERLGQAGGR